MFSYKIQGNSMCKVRIARQYSYFDLHSVVCIMKYALWNVLSVMCKLHNAMCMVQRLQFNLPSEKQYSLLKIYFVLNVDVFCTQSALFTKHSYTLHLECTFRDQLDESARLISQMDHLDGSARRTSQTDQLDGSARRTSSLFSKFWPVRIFEY